MNKNLSHSRSPFLLPLSWLYGVGVWLRNKLFDAKILKSQKYDIPIICVGNITVGGTGKTPHIEYLIRVLSPNYKVAVLSRGYKRKTHGYMVVNEDSSPIDVGDEPLQIKTKFPDTIVVVDKNRRNAIEILSELDETIRPDVILLDDGFQHRYVQPSKTILLIDYNRSIYNDKLLPLGNLRENINAISRASMVIITKCKPDIQPIELRIVQKQLNLFVYQNLFFTSFRYGNVLPVFTESEQKWFALSDLSDKHVLLVTGIANNQPLIEMLQQNTKNLHTLLFSDHHYYEEKDIIKIKEDLKQLPGENSIIITTEKDAIRFRSLSFLDDDLKSLLYYMPIETYFIKEEEKEFFNKKIRRHVKSYKSGRKLSKG